MKVEEGTSIYDKSIYDKRNPKLIKDSSFNTYRKQHENANKYFKPNEDDVS